MASSFRALLCMGLFFSFSNRVSVAAAAVTHEEAQKYHAGLSHAASSPFAISTRRDANKAQITAGISLATKPT
jgi:hypothetical protein